VYASSVFVFLLAFLPYIFLAFVLGLNVEKEYNHSYTDKEKKKKKKKKYYYEFSYDFTPLILCIILSIPIIFLCWGFVFWTRMMLNMAWQWTTILFPINIIISFSVLVNQEDKLHKSIILFSDWILGILTVLSLLFLIIGVPIILANMHMDMAYWVDENIDYVTGELPFNNEALDTDIRLVTKDFAISIAKQHSSVFGSHLQIADMNVVKINGTLYWLLLYRYETRIPERNNKIVGIILVNTNNPNAEPIVIKVKDFNYADNLWYNHRLNVLNFRRDNTHVWSGEGEYTYTRNYPAWDNELKKWVYVCTKTTKDVWGRWYADGIDIIDVSDGSLLKSYSLDEYDHLPDYVIQVYSEKLIERMVDRWGKKRDTRYDTNISFWAGWGLFRRASQDRFEWVEDLRYIVNPDNRSEVIAVLPTIPRTGLLSSSKSLFGLFKVDRTGHMTYYDLRDFGLISTDTVERIAEGMIVSPSGGSYNAGMPILYTIETAVGYRLAYYIPVYWTNGELYRLSYFCIIDAKDTNMVAMTEAEGMSASEVVRETRLEFKSMFSNNTNVGDDYTIAEVKNIGSYVVDDNTIFVFELNNSHILRCSREYLTEQQWNEVVLTTVSSTIKYQYFIDENNILWATEFYRLF